MSGITVTITPEALNSLERHAANMRRVSEVFQAHAARVVKVAEAVRRSPRYKAQESKRRLVALLTSYTPAQVLELFVSIAQVSRSFEGWLSELFALSERTLVSSHGPNSPPVRSAFRHGALSA